MDYTLDTTDFAGLGVTEAKASYASLAAGALTLTMVLPTLDSVPVPWVYGDRLTLTRAGRVIFSGTVTSLAVRIGQPDYTCRITVQDDWWILDHTTYAKFVNDSSGGNYAVPGGFPGCDPGRRTAPLKGAVLDIVGWATAMRARLSMDIDSITIPFASTGSDSCASLLSAALKWRPDVVTRIAYRPDGATLEITTPVKRGRVTIPLSSLAVDSVEFGGRPDLVPPVCALVGKYGDYILPPGGDIHTPGSYIYAVPPDDYTSSDPDDPAAMADKLKPYKDKVIHVGIKAPTADRNGQLDDRYVKPRHDGTALGPPPSGTSKEDLGDSYRRFWARSFPELGALKGVEYGVTAIQTIDEAPEEFYSPDAENGEMQLHLPANYSTSMTSSYALCHGSFSTNNKHVRFNYCTVHQYARVAASVVEALPAAERDKVRSLFASDEIDETGKRYYKRLMSCRFCNISHPRGWERSDQAESGEGNPAPGGDGGGNHDDDTVDYHAVLDDYYAATRVTQWEGTCHVPLGIEGHEACDLVGCRLGITGGRPEWESMSAVIQAVDVNLKTGSITLTCRATGHLSFDTYSQLRDLARLRDGSAASPRPPDPATSAAPGEQPEAPVTISPMFGVETMSFSTGGMQIGAFRAYRRSDGIWWTSGGLVMHGGKLSLIPPTRVGGSGNEAIMAVPRRLKGGGYEYVLKRAPITHPSSSSSSSASSGR